MCLGCATGVCSLVESKEVVRVFYRNVLKYLQIGSLEIALKSQRRDTHLLHQHVDVQLGVIQHVAVGLVQALQGPLHRLAVNVDPAGSTRGQELPVWGGQGDSPV